MKFVYLPLMICIGILAGYISLLMCHQKLNQLQKDLDSNEKNIYNKIKKQRQFYYSIGLLIGFLLACIYYKIFEKYKFFFRFTCSLLIFLAIPIFVYLLIPVQKYFLEIVNDDKVKMEWFKVYNCMKYNFTLYFVGGFLFSGFILNLC